MGLSIFGNESMTAHQIGYAAMTLLLILAFIFQAVCFSFNNWYRMDVGPFVMRTGLWEMRIYDEKNVTGLDKRHHKKTEFRFYDPIWKSVIDKTDQMANVPPPKKQATKKPKNKEPNEQKNTKPTNRAADGDIIKGNDLFIDPDYYEYEHFKPGEDWFSLPRHIPRTLWDDKQSDIDAAEALFSITWMATFLLMCLFAFHQFVPNFQVTLAVMRTFCTALFLAGVLGLISLICYGNALPAICHHLVNAFEKSPNPKFAEAARTSSHCSFGHGYTLSTLSGIFLICTGIMTAVRICKLQREEKFDLGNAAGTAVSFGKLILAGGALAPNSHPQPGTQTIYDWNQPPPSSAYSAGYEQAGDGYQGGTW